MMTDLTTLPLADGPWEAAHIKFSEHPLGARVLGPLADAGLVLVVDVEHDMVVGSELVASNTPASVAETIVKIMLDPATAAPSVRPERLLLRDAEVRDALMEITDGAIPEMEVVDDFALLDIVAHDVVLSIVSRIEAREQPLVDDATTAFFFRSAVSFYNAKPWQLLDERDTLEITFGTRAPMFATVTGASGDGLVNIGASILSGTEIESSGNDNGGEHTNTNAQVIDINTRMNANIDADGDESADDDTIATSIEFTSLSIAIVSDNDAPSAWRDLRRLKKWPLASPQAFPMPLATDADGMSRLPNADEMRELSVCLNVIAVTVATKRKEIESGEFRSHDVTVRDERSVAWTAAVRFASDSQNGNGDELPNDERMMPVMEIRATAMQLANAAQTLERLLWNFFLGDGPGYAENEEEEMSADIRFVDWAVFAYRADGRTLAEQAVEKLSETRSLDELTVHRRALAVRVGEFRVEAVHDDGMTVHDSRQRATLAIADAYASQEFKVGDIIVGMLHEIADDLYVLSPGGSVLDEFEGSSALRSASTERFAPMLEAELFGATHEWIQQLPETVVAEAYSSFRESLKATGDTLPDFTELQRSVALASAPADVVATVSPSVVWWTDNELQVMLAFVMRTWNVTLRKELNGLSPDEAAARRNPPRRAKPSGTRRRR